MQKWQKYFILWPGWSLAIAVRERCLRSVQLCAAVTRRDPCDRRRLSLPPEQAKVNLLIPHEVGKRQKSSVFLGADPAQTPANDWDGSTHATRPVRCSRVLDRDDEEVTTKLRYLCQVTSIKSPTLTGYTAVQRRRAPSFERVFLFIYTSMRAGK